jgi:hypothetical protein
VKNDITFNVSFKESLTRGFIAVFQPSFYVLVDHYLIFVAIPISVYLYITALSHFCPIRYAWRHYIKHKIDVAHRDLPAELYIPQ